IDVEITRSNLMSHGKSLTSFTMSTFGPQQISAFGGKADMGSVGNSRCRLCELPGAISHDLVARARRVSGVAQREASDLQATAYRFQQQASYSPASTGLMGAQTGPVAMLDGSGSRGIQAPRSFVVVIMR